MTGVIADAIAEGLIARSGAAEAGKDDTVEPLAEWEKELLEGNAVTENVADASAAEVVAEVATEVVEAPAATETAAE